MFSIDLYTNNFGMNLKSEIVERSVDLFKNMGCRRVTMDDVAIANGISKRTLYEIFESKDALLEGTLLFMQSEMEKSLKQYQTSNKNVIEIVCDIHRDHKKMNFSWKHIFLSELKRYHYKVYKNLLVKLIDLHRKSVKEFIERGQREGIIREDINKEIAKDALLEFSTSSENRQLNFIGAYSPKELFQGVVLVYVRGLCTPKGIKIIEENIGNRL